MAASAMVNVSVNIVGEYSELDEDIAQDYLQQFDEINCVLAGAGLASFQEPDHIIDWDYEDENRQFLNSIPVTYIHCLRRAYALMTWLIDAGNPELSFVIPQVEDDNISSWDRLVDEVALKKRSHLCVHSDCKGFYLPTTDMTTPLECSMVTRSIPVEGDILGSSYHLLDELITIAPYIGINLEDDARLSRTEACRLYDIAQNCTAASFRPLEAYARETAAWLTLHQAAEMSIRNETAIVFTKMAPSAGRFR